MGRHKHSINSITLEAIEQAILSIPNGAVVRKLTILSSFPWLKTEEIAKAYRINPPHSISLNRSVLRSRS